MFQGTGEIEVGIQEERNGFLMKENVVAIVQDDITNGPSSGAMWLELRYKNGMITLLKKKNVFN